MNQQAGGYHHFLKFVYFFVLLYCVSISVSYETFFARDSIWTLASQLRFHQWHKSFHFFWIIYPLTLSFTFALALVALISRPRSGYPLVFAFLMAILVQRNVWITDSGDKFFVILLVWCWLLHLDHPQPSKLLRTLFAIQLAVVYFQNGVFKLNKLWMIDGTALNLIFSYPGSAFPWVIPFTKYNLAWLSRIIPILEILLPFLLFTRWKRKVAKTFIVYHLSTAATMNLGFFAPVMILAWCLYLNLEKTTQMQSCSRRLPSVIGTVWLSMTILQTFIYLMGYKIPSWIERPLALSYLRQHWSMFYEPRNQIPQYRFSCSKNGVSQPCGVALDQWTRRASWTKKQLMMMDKLAFGEKLILARRDFHQYLCKQNANIDAIKIDIKIIIKDEATGKFLREEPRMFLPSGVCPVAKVMDRS